MNKEKFVAIDEKFFWDEIVRSDIKWSTFYLKNKYGLESLSNNEHERLLFEQKLEKMIDDMYDFLIYKIINEEKFGILMLKHSDKIIRVFESETS